VALIPLFGALMAALVAAPRYFRVRLPDLPVEFTWEQIHVLVGGFAALMAVAWLIALGDRGLGIWSMVFGSCGALGGAVLLRAARAARSS
jgi:hypothetical protein